MHILVGKRKKIDRSSSCVQCRMLAGLCLCPSLPHLNLKTKLVLFIHQKEFGRLTNTGILAHRVLQNSQVVFRGRVCKSVTRTEDFLTDPGRTFILFPAGEATDLDETFLQKNPGPLTLICPDGHWGQAKKLIRHEPSLQHLPFVKLPTGQASTYRLRRNIQPGRVCTFEAITRALGVIEGPGVQKDLELIFDKMVTRLLWARGRLPANQITW